jgi:hypothetical protein
MRKIDALLKEMKDRIQDQKTNINEFATNQQATATDLYRADYYAELTRKQTERLGKYIKRYDDTDTKDRKERKRAKENVRLQANVLKVTYDAFHDQLEALTQKMDFQIAIDGKMTEQKQRMSNLLKKAEKIIHPHLYS